MNIEWLLVGIVGFEPTNNRVKVCCLDRLTISQNIGADCTNRTYNINQRLCNLLSADC